MAIMARASSRKVRASLPQAGLVLASTGKPFSAAAIDLAAARARQAAESRVRGGTVARVHGASFGLQHPGLMPHKKGKETPQQGGADASRARHEKGLEGD